MDYKYIEQLLERYWQGDTSVQEEAILRAFFAQDEVPAGLSQYKPYFNYADVQKQADVLGDDFDSRLMALIGDEPQTVKARTVSLQKRLLPLFRAAAIVAIILTLGNAVQFSMQQPQQADDINYANYTDTYQDPAVAYDNVESALQLISEGFAQVINTDSIMAASLQGNDTIKVE